jgi:hypothetical protein
MNWPIGTATVVLDSVRTMKAERADLLAALKRSNVVIASVALLPIDASVKRLAAEAAAANRKLIKRCEGKR